MAFLTDRTLATGVTAQDLIHIVKPYDATQNPAGSSYKATIQQTLEAITGATQVMILSSGIGSVERCGNGNDANGDCSTVSGGQSNTTLGQHSVIAGGRCNTTTLSNSNVSGGFRNTASNYYSVIGGGCRNTTLGASNTIGGGQFNTTCSTNSTIGGGLFNQSRCSYSTIAGGCQNYSIGCFSVISGGANNTTSGIYSSILGGICNCNTDCYSTIGGGNLNTTRNIYNSIIGGSGNTVSHDFSSAVGFAIKSVSACTFHVNYLALNNTPINDQTLTEYLVRDSSTGVVKYKTTQPTYISTTDVTVANYTANTSFAYYGVTFSGNTNIEIPLPTGIDGFSFKIKDERGTASSYPITVTTPVGLIDGSGSVVMNINYMSLLFVARNNNWWIV
jgi:hypothetical protein